METILLVRPRSQRPEVRSARPRRWYAQAVKTSAWFFRAAASLSRSAPARFQQVVSAADVDIQSSPRIVICRALDLDSGQVKDGVDIVFGDGAHEEPKIEDRRGDIPYVFEDTLTDKNALWLGIL